MKSVSLGEGRGRKKLWEITLDLFAQEDGTTAMHQMAKAQFQHRRQHANHRDDDADNTEEFLDTFRESELFFLARKNAHDFPSISD